MRRLLDGIFFSFLSFHYVFSFFCFSVPVFLRGRRPPLDFFSRERERERESFSLFVVWRFVEKKIRFW